MNNTTTPFSSIAPSSTLKRAMYYQYFCESSEGKAIVLQALKKYTFLSLEDRQDICQDVSLEAWRWCERTDTRITGSYSSWIYKVATNAAKYFYKTKHTRREKSKKDFSSMFYADGLACNTWTDKEARLAVLAQAVSELPFNERTVINLYLEGFSIPEISDKLGADLGDVTRLFGKAKKRFKARRGGYIANHYSPDIPLYYAPVIVRNGETAIRRSDKIVSNSRTLDEGRVKEIRSLLEQGKGYKEIAGMFGVSRQTIGSIKTGRKPYTLPVYGQTG